MVHEARLEIDRVDDRNLPLSTKEIVSPYLSVTDKHAVLLQRGRNSQDQLRSRLSAEPPDGTRIYATLSLTISRVENQDVRHWRRGQQRAGFILRSQTERRIPTSHT